MNRIGVAIVGVNGAVASTVIAGVELMKRGFAPRVGMITEKTDARIAESITELLDLAPLESLVFAGWDLQFANAYEGALHHKVLPAHVLEQVSAELERVRPWPAVFAKSYVGKLTGENVIRAGSFREEVAILERNLETFKKEQGLDRVVMVNLASTERFLDEQPAHNDLRSFEAGLDANDPAITPAMRYFYAANRLRIPYCNFTPSLTNVPALAQQAVETGNPFAGMDGKTGQTLVKTALASMFRARRLLIEGWYSANVLGNSDGMVLDDPSSNKTKVLSKANVLDSIVGYKVENHQVHIHYYKPRGDSKEAWDNIDIVGFAGVPMQMKINFLCQDSVLAAPLVIDLVRLLDVAKRVGERGIQRQLSMFFKSPYHAPGEAPVHDFFKQEKLLLEWARAHANPRPQVHTNGVKAHVERTP
jgi:myo-inositol-1-phosphate synthase